MRKLLVFVLACATVMAIAPGAQAAEPRYVTILFGRTQWAQAENCVQMPGAVTLGQVADAMTARGLTATANIVWNQVPNSGFWCEGGFSLHPGWDRIQPLVNAGWHVSSAGKYYRAFSSLTPSQQRDASCGSLPLFRQRGIDASGLFSYPNDSWSVTAQTNVVSTCFDWGRTYGTGITSRWTAGPPWFQSTHTTQGANCSIPNAGCPYAAQEKWRYTHPDRILATMTSLQPDQWYSVQFYRFVTGSNLDPLDRFRWDCRATNPGLHWATRPEVYCWSDFVRVLDGLANLRTTSGLVVTDPATVANAWGRSV
ncbi:MAG TPA: hypothetical protein VF235_08520 [Actinomycetota bacterium]